MAKSLCETACPSASYDAGGEVEHVSCKDVEELEAAHAREIQKLKDQLLQQTRAILNALGKVPGK